MKPSADRWRDVPDATASKYGSQPADDDATVASFNLHGLKITSPSDRDARHNVHNVRSLDVT